MKKPLYAVLAVVIAVSAIVVGVKLKQRAGETDIEAVTQAEVNRQIEALKKQQPKTFQGKTGKLAEQGIKKSIEKQIRINELIKVEADKRGVTASDNEVDIAVAQVRQAYASDKKFNNDLKRQGLTLDQYKKNIKDQIIMSKMMKEVTKDVKVTDKEARAYYNANKAEFGNKPYKDVEDQVKQKLLQQKQRSKINDFIAEIQKKAE